MASQLTENTLLTQLPVFGRVITPNAFAYIKREDGYLYNWANGVYHRIYEPGKGEFPDGSLAFKPNEQRPTYVKRGRDSWLITDPSNKGFAPTDPTAQTAGQHGAGPSAAALRILYQAPYHSGPVPLDDLVVRFDAPMPSAENGHVADGAAFALTGELAQRSKASIRFGFPYVELSEYRSRQHNLRRDGAPITRGYLASLVAQEVRLIMVALQRLGKPILRPSDGRPVAFEDMILVDVRHVSHGTLQPTIAVRGP